MFRQSKKPTYFKETTISPKFNLKIGSYVLFMLLSFLYGGCEESMKHNDYKLSIIPKPLNLNLKEGQFKFDSSVEIKSKSNLQPIADYIKKKIVKLTGIETGLHEPKKWIQLNINKKFKPEHYELTVFKDSITITAGSEAGVFLGGQSLLQLFPLGIKKDIFLPCLKIKDEPRFSWRGAHLDVSRHFFDVAFIKKYIDLLAIYKINTLHLHLTDDQGWRLEIKQYPKLTQIGAWRSSIGFNSNQEKGLNKNSDGVYGGFYTHEDIKEIVKYAKSRYVNIVPEIEMPGHTSAVLKAYPELSCRGTSPANIWTDAGVSENLFCAGTERTFNFLENVLTEVMELFPSEYIHIGGDEAPKKQWKNCSLCQTKIKDEGLESEEELQTYFIQRIEKFLNKNGRKLIGWDEILEDGLSPNATIMAWRGTEHGEKAVKQNYNVVMTPTKPLYLNHAPIQNSTGPGHEYMGNTLTSIYDFEPVPKDLTKQQAKHIIGVQANLWTEYVPKPELVEQLAFPRLFSLAEIAWTSPDNKSFNEFRSRLDYHFKLLDLYDVNYGQDAFDVRITLNPDIEKRILFAILYTEIDNRPIHFTTDGSPPTLASPLYTTPIKVEKSITIKAASLRPNGVLGLISSKDIVHHKAIACPVVYNEPYSKDYNGGGTTALVDGIQSKEVAYTVNGQMFNGNNLDVIIDLGEIKGFSSISTSFLNIQIAWAFPPNEVVYLVSKDGKSYDKVFETHMNASKKNNLIEIYTVTAKDLKTSGRYIKVFAKNIGTYPKWHDGYRLPATMVVDEIIVK